MHFPIIILLSFLKIQNVFTENLHVVTEDVEFVQLRLKYLALSTPDNITALREIQKEEFKNNESYKEGWENAVNAFSNRKEKIFKHVANDSIARTAPDEYHIAIIAYTGNLIYQEFNQMTRDICSGKHIREFKYKTFFKFLLLAIQTLGMDPVLNDETQTLYRGLGGGWELEIGQIIGFQQFQSSSTDIDVADNFSNGGMFELHGPFCGTTLNIKYHSEYEGEDEILVSPFQVYKVEGVEPYGSYVQKYNLSAYYLPEQGPACKFQPKKPTAVKSEMTTQSTFTKTSAPRRTTSTSTATRGIATTLSTRETSTSTPANLKYSETSSRIPQIPLASSEMPSRATTEASVKTSQRKILSTISPEATTSTKPTSEATKRTVATSSEATTRTVPTSKATTSTVPTSEATTRTVATSKATTRTVLTSSEATTRTVATSKATTRTVLTSSEATTRTVPTSKATTRTVPTSKATTRTVLTSSEATTRTVPTSKATTRTVATSLAASEATTIGKSTSSTEAFLRGGPINFASSEMSITNSPTTPKTFKTRICSLFGNIHNNKFINCSILVQH